MPVINRSNSFVEIFKDNKIIAKSTKFGLCKPMLYVHKLNIPLSKVVLKLGKMYAWISTPDNFIVIPKIKMVSNITFFKNGNGTINDITLISDGVYINFELPKFQNIVNNLRRGKGIIIP